MIPTRITSCLAALLLGLLAGCVVPPNSKTGLMDVSERPAERSLLAGIRAYEDGQYPQAEQSLNQALTAGLASPKDRARPTSTLRSSSARATGWRLARRSSARRAVTIRRLR